jgi:hypothetical protein
MCIPSKLGMLGKTLLTNHTRYEISFLRYHLEFGFWHFRPGINAKQQIPQVGSLEPKFVVFQSAITKQR